MWTKPRFWYHLSVNDLGYKAYFEPREIEYGFNEPARPRICVAPTVAHCLAAIYFYERFYVYRTYRKVSARYPYNVCDSYITKERWLLDETCFLQKLTIDYDELKIDKFNRARGNPSMLNKQEHDYEEICLALIKSGLVADYPHIDFIAPKTLRKLSTMV